MTAKSKKIRSKTVSSAVPGLAQGIINYYQGICSESGLASARIEVDMVPKSLNHQYIRTVNYKKRTNIFGKIEKKGFINTRLHGDVEIFRTKIKYAAASNRVFWQPSGITAAVIIFESPYWVTKAHTVRQMDADNKVKAVFDAIEHATGAKDQYHWQFHVFKMWSKREKTTTYLFDLGDIIEVHQDG